MRLILFFLIVNSTSAESAASSEFPDAHALLKRVLSQAKENEAAERYEHRKLLTIETLSDNGAVKKKAERLYQVEWVGDREFSRIISIDGRALSKRELRRETTKEKRFRESVAKGRTEEEKSDDRMLDAEKFRRFAWAVTGRTNIAGRSSWRLTFQPKPVLDGNTESDDLQDRLLEHIEGALLIDNHDYAVTHLDFDLIEPFSFGWLGVLGSIQELEFSLTRKRLSSGVWVKDMNTLKIRGRKVFSGFHARLTETRFGFRLPPGSE